MNDIFKLTATLEAEQYPRDYRECLKDVMRECMTAEDIRDTCNMFDVTYEQYFDDMCQSYLRYKHELLRAYMKNARQDNI